MSRGLPKDRPSPRAGFTLVEVLVALTLLSVIAGLLMGGFRLGLSAQERGHEVTDDAATLLLARRQFTELTARAVPWFDPNTGRLAFSGKEWELRFPVFMPGYPTHGGLFEVSFLSVPDPSGEYRFIFRRRPFLPNQDQAQADENAWETATLFRAGERVTFSYLDRTEEEVVPQPEWQVAQRLPDTIRLTLPEDARKRFGVAQIVGHLEARFAHQCLQLDDGGLTLSIRAECRS